MESRSWENFAFGIWNLESGIQLKESGIPSTIGIQNPSSIYKNWNPVPGIRNPQCGIQDPRLSWIPLHQGNFYATLHPNFIAFFCSLVTIQNYNKLIFYVLRSLSKIAWTSSFILQSTFSKTVWLLGTKPLHCSSVLRRLEFHPCPEEFKKEGEVRPLVVLFGWLLAKSRHLHKYGELYHQHGADVITVKLEVMEVGSAGGKVVYHKTPLNAQPH